MAATRIEVKGKATEDGKIEVAATANGNLVFERTCESLDEARDEFGITHGQKGHDVYREHFGTNYYIADLLDEDEKPPKAVGMPRGRAKKKRKR